DDIAVAREHLRVPAEVPAIGVRGMGTAVDRMQQGPLPIRIEARRIRHPHLHGLSTPALDAELPRLAEPSARAQRAAQGLDRPLALPVALDREQRRRILERRPTEDDPRADA